VYGQFGECYINGIGVFGVGIIFVYYLVKVWAVNEK